VWYAISAHDSKATAFSKALKIVFPHTKDACPESRQAGICKGLILLVKK
jgi:hypothetical protein